LLNVLKSRGSKRGDVLYRPDQCQRCAVDFSSDHTTSYPDRFPVFDLILTSVTVFRNMALSIHFWPFLPRIMNAA
jgi:hypothetical protein